MRLRGVARDAHNIASKALLEPVLRYEWTQGMAESPASARLTEYSVALGWLANSYPETLLDVGPGGGSWPHLLSRTGIAVTAIDSMGYLDPGRSGRHSFFNRHYYVIRDDIRAPTLDRHFDCVTCLSVLELIRDHDAAVRGLFSLVKPGGFLILTFPYNERTFVENAYALRQARDSYGPTLYLPAVFSRGSRGLAFGERWGPGRSGALSLLHRRVLGDRRADHAPCRRWLPRPPPPGVHVYPKELGFRSGGVRRLAGPTVQAGSPSWLSLRRLAPLGAACAACVATGALVATSDASVPVIVVLGIGILAVAAFAISAEAALVAVIFTSPIGLEELTGGDRPLLQSYGGWAVSSVRLGVLLLVGLAVLALRRLNRRLVFEE